jgi:hypothetical protein
MKHIFQFQFIQFLLHMLISKNESKGEVIPIFKQLSTMPQSARLSISPALTSTLDGG